jgi:hypothetical protein
MKIKKIALFTVALGFSLSSFAQSGLKQESVSIFKNSTAFFVKSGQVTTKDKKWEIVGDTIPRALNGTFWLSSPSKEMSIAKSFLQDKEVLGLAGQFSDMFLANDGKKVRFLPAGDSSWMEGKIKVLQTPNPDPSKPAIKSGALFALIQNNGNTSMLTQAQVNSCRKVEFLEQPSFTNASIQKLPVMQVNFTTAKEKQPLNLMYLSQGISWTPDYLIELIAEDKARMTLRTTVINNAEDIEVAKLNMVAGVPNFKYATTIADFLNHIQSYNNVGSKSPVQTYQNYAAPSMLNSAVYDNAPDSDRGSGYNPAPTGNVGNAEGSSVEDLFFYSIDNVVIKKGERALLDVFTAEIPVEHVYEVILNQNSASYTTAYSFEQQKLPVIHTLKLSNTSDYVWTSAPAMVVKNDKGRISPISQDLLKYTSKKDNINLKLTEAPDVALKFTEKEINRKVNDKSVKEANNRVRYYDQVSIEAEIEIQNYKSKDIRLDVKRAIIGKLQDSNEKWKLNPRLKSYDSYNPYTDVVWEMKMKAGETKKIVFKYEIFVSHY